MFGPALLRIALCALEGLRPEASFPLPVMQAIVAAHRKAIVLLESPGQAALGLRARATIVGRILFQDQHQRSTQLAERLAAEIREAGRAGWAAPPPSAQAFLEALETETAWQGADRLAFRDMVTHLTAAAGTARGRGSPLARAFAERLAAAGRSLADSAALYGLELNGSVSGRRPAWSQYVAFVCSLYDREAVLREYAAELDAIEQTRAARGLPEGPLEVSGSELPLGTVLLSFDDGPHRRFTDAILETLQAHRVKAVFFEVGERVGRVEPDEEVKESSGAAIAGRVHAAGMTIGNHSFTHPLMPRLSDEAIADEIEKTNLLLAEILGGPPALFRPPYGAADERVLAAIEARQMRAMLWTVDSKDWADPIAASIAERVIREVRAQGCGIVLFHDIHGQTTEALPIVLQVLQAAGFRFLAWNAGANAPDGSFTR